MKKIEQITNSIRFSLNSIVSHTERIDTLVSRLENIIKDKEYMATLSDEEREVVTEIREMMREGVEKEINSIITNKK